MKPQQCFIADLIYSNNAILFYINAFILNKKTGKQLRKVDKSDKCKEKYYFSQLYQIITNKMTRAFNQRDFFLECFVMRYKELAWPLTKLY